MTPSSELARLMALLESDRRLTPQEEADALAAVQAPHKPRQAVLALPAAKEPRG